MFLKQLYFKIGLIFEKAAQMSCDPFKVWMVSLDKSMKKWLGWKEEEVFEELKALAIHLNDGKSLIKVE